MTKLLTTKTLATIALLVLMAGPAAFAQTGNSGSGSNSAKPSSGPLPAPVGHRQPRADQVPSEQNLSDPNNPVNKEDAALDRKIKSICRGC
ncbi:hypothetical protein SAMN05444159_0192 [Bradyrhizobium lablabi]|uniref:Uncharacterized protein n=1 Tax=Bradyrhizobium lablabi TaxID=722472 RepID=A0A1M6I1D6_9BRAD|nr:hypothetical protein [Bradyrhizobium lablabi]SHJ28299.1 hypothetical protein SAMN05444159_0192 [Bradyrhizobium lablabi]